MTDHRLFGELAHRYDVHTPAAHYQHDHTFVLEMAQTLRPAATLLDVGCGTGTLLKKAREAGLDAVGIDAAPGMVAVAAQRLGAGVVDVGRMEDLAVARRFDVVCALSWTLNYVRSDDAVHDVVRRMASALAPGGILVLQVAHADNAGGEVFVDRESGPTGERDDVTFIYRFTRCDQTTLAADYVYACSSARELLVETHHLHAADARLVAAACRDAQLVDVEVFDSWRRDPFDSSLSPLVTARRAR